jgi:hypothetical protein
MSAVSSAASHLIFGGGGGGGGIHINIQMSVHSNIDDTGRWIRDHSKQIRFATAVALTRTAKRLVPIMEAEVRKVFDRPLPFTVRAFGTTLATKQTLTSTLYIKPKQAAYLRPNIDGGLRRQKSFERKLANESGVDGYWVPGQGLRLSTAGNMTERQIKEIAASLSKSGKYQDVFVGVPRNMPSAPFGIWARVKRGRGRKATNGLKPLLVRIPQPGYKKRFEFYEIGHHHAQRIFNEEFAKAFADAQRSVRPISQTLKRH